MSRGEKRAPMWVITQYINTVIAKNSICYNSKIEKKKYSL